MHLFLMRLLGIVFLLAALCLVAFCRRAAVWLGRPYGFWGIAWQAWASETGGCLYRLYRAYTTVSGWFYVIFLTLILAAFGYQLLMTGKWY